MRNILRFMKGLEGYVVLIFLLLIVQARCDLSLPAYTSSILNTGLQQKGIEKAAPEKIRSTSLDDLFLFLTEEDMGTVDAAYTEPDAEGVRELREDADPETVSRLLMTPEAILFQIQNSGAGDLPLAAVKASLKTGLLTKEGFLAQVDERMQSYGNLSESFLNQVAVSFVASEYSALGMDLSGIQNSYLLKVGMKMMLMVLLMTVTAILTGFLAARTSAQVGRSLRERIYEKVMSFTGAEMEHFSTASLITRSTNDVQQIQIVVVILLRMVAYAPILAVFGIVNVVRTRSGMSWIIVLAVVLLSAAIGILLGIAMPKFRKMQSLVDRLNLVSREILTGILPIRAFSRESYEEQRFEKASRDLYQTQLFTSRTMSVLMPYMMLIMNGISVLIVWIGAGKVDQGTIQVGDLTAFITYSMVIVMGFLTLTAIALFLPRAGVAADRIAEVLETPLSLTDPEHPRDEEIKDGKGVLEFQNVSFSYPGAESSTLSGISFTAEPGKITAVIGSTGCGKSTLIKLIPRFYDVTEGKITLDGVDIREISQKTLRSRIGYVPQKGMLFSGTIESNIRYGGEGITEQDMKEAAHVAQAEEFISGKSDGYRSEISQEGSNVSGGQRQRLSIARAIAKHPRVYLFDDSFSALDYKTDLALRTELMRYTGDSTVIIVAQRISTILRADRILCMENGRIAGAGTHEELLASCPTYREIAESQLSESELNGKGGVN